MKVKYRHISEPNTVKEYDTEVSYKSFPAIFERRTLDEWNSIELENFRRDKERGVILDYRVEEG